jgi:beta-N-acetylhexosaminidase
MAALGKLWDSKPDAACEAARQVGYVLASELRARGVDYSFTPVLDLDYGPSRVIGDRAFHRQPAAVIALAKALGEGFTKPEWAAAANIIQGTGTSFQIPMWSCPLMIVLLRTCRKTWNLTGSFP